ncbi:MAG TPA: response regulator transcription factor [Ignavibacteriaceae bacterium]|nr:response regulator transcription factor [Ignavibacteriaceae bacterium]
MKNEKNIRILLGDDHSLLREGITSILQNEKDLFIVGEAENGVELVDKYFKLKPDIVITDITMPKMSGTDASKKIKRKEPEAKILFLSMHEGEEYIYYTYKAGGSGLVNKNIIKGELIFAIRKVLNGEFYFGPDIDSNILGKIIESYSSDYNYLKNKYNLDISEREVDVLHLIGDGLSSTEIADKLGVGKRTIDTHRINLMQKLNLKNLPALIRFAVNFNQEFKDKPTH